MQTVTAIEALRAQIRQWRQAGQRIGFVPTMGNLHAGHLALMAEAARRCERVVASIFVNPLQFDEQADLDAYPRTLAADRARLEEQGIDLLFAPDEATLYPRGRDTITRVSVTGLDDLLEGAARPGHFIGVATVVTKLFNCVQPDLAVFGEKDFQQLLVIRRLVADLDMPVEILGLPTVREADGLAMSSRNQRLSETQRRLAPALYRELQRLRARIREGDTDYPALEQAAGASLAEQGFVPDYVAIRDADTLMPIDETTRNRVILAAARLGDTRLIDNLRV